MKISELSTLTLVEIPLFLCALFRLLLKFLSLMASNIIPFSVEHTSLFMTRKVLVQASSSPEMVIVQALHS